MTPEETGKAYDRIADRWHSERFNHRSGIAQHQRALAFVPEGKTALDVGCGCSGRFFDLLLDQGYTPEGLDVSSEMIRIVRSKYPALTIYHADICEWNPRKKSTMSWGPRSTIQHLESPDSWVRLTGRAASCVTLSTTSIRSCICI